MGFSRQEYWSRLPCPPPGDLLDPQIKPVSLSLLHWQTGSLPLVPPGRPAQVVLFSSVHFSGSVVSDSLQPHGLQHSRPLCPWDSPGKNTGVGCHALLQGIFKPRNQNHVSCVSCITGGLFTTEPPRTPTSSHPFLLSFRHGFF